MYNRPDSARYSWTKRFLDGLKRLRIAGILQLKGPSNGVHLILTKETDQTVSHKLVTSQEKGVQSRYIPCLVGQKKHPECKNWTVDDHFFTFVLENWLNIETKSATSLNKGAIISWIISFTKNSLEPFHWPQKVWSGLVHKFNSCLIQTILDGGQGCIDTLGVGDHAGVLRTAAQGVVLLGNHNRLRIKKNMYLEGLRGPP